MIPLLVYERKIILDFKGLHTYTTIMTDEKLPTIAPENIEVANTYVETNSIADTAKALDISKERVSAILKKREVENYITAIYMDSGYRNRFRLAETLDEIIEHKLEEMRESEMGSKKDIAELLQLAHKMRMDELAFQEKHKTTESGVKQQTNILMGGDVPMNGNYGVLLSKLMKGEFNDVSD